MCKESQWFAKSHLCLDKQQGMVAQGVERIEAGKLGAAHFLTHQLQRQPAWTCNHLQCIQFTS